MPRQKALFLLLFTAVCWSCSGVLVKSVSWNPLAIASTRGLLAGITVFALAGGFKGELKIKDLTLVHFASGLSLAILSLFFIVAMKFTTAANAIVLNYSAPVWVAILAPCVIKERTKGRDWLYIGVIFGGVLLFFAGDLSPVGFWGNICALGSGFFFGVQALCLRFLKKGSPASAMVIGNLLTFCLGLGFWGPPWPDSRSLLFLLALGVFQMGVSSYLYTLASPYVSSLELVLVTMVEPILNPFWVFLALGERPGPFALVGGIIVILGVMVWSFGKNGESLPLPPREKGHGNS